MVQSSRLRTKEHNLEREVVDCSLAVVVRRMERREVDYSPVVHLHTHRKMLAGVGCIRDLDSALVVRRK